MSCALVHLCINTIDPYQVITGTSVMHFSYTACNTTPVYIINKILYLS